MESSPEPPPACAPAYSLPLIAAELACPTCGRAWRFTSRPATLDFDGQEAWCTRCRRPIGIYRVVGGWTRLSVATT